MGNLRLMRVDQWAVEPVAPVRPKRMLVLALGLVLGLVVGVGAALGRSVLRYRS